MKMMSRMFSFVLALVMMFEVSLSLSGCMKIQKITIPVESSPENSPSSESIKPMRSYETNYNPYMASDDDYTYIVNYNCGKGETDYESYEIIRQRNTEEGDIIVLADSRDFISDGVRGSFYWLTLSDEKLYFMIEKEDDYKLYWVSTDGTARGDADISNIKSVLLEILSYSSDLSSYEGGDLVYLLYLFGMYWGTGQSTKILIYPDYFWGAASSKAWIADISDDSVYEWDLMKNANEYPLAVAFTGETFYYTKLSDPIYEYPALGEGFLYAYNLETGEEQLLSDFDITAYINDWSLNRHSYDFPSVVEDSLYIPEHRDLVRIDLTTGDKNVVCQFDWGEPFDYGYGILGNKIYFTGCRDNGLDNNSLYCCDPNGGNVERVATYSGDDYFGIQMVGISNGYLYYYDDGENDPWYRRVSLTNPVLPGSFVHQDNE